MCCFTHHRGDAEPDERLRCVCTAAQQLRIPGDDARGLRCIRRATQEDRKCDICGGRAGLTETLVAGFAS